MRIFCRAIFLILPCFDEIDYKHLASFLIDIRPPKMTLLSCLFYFKIGGISSGGGGSISDDHECGSFDRRDSAINDHNHPNRNNLIDGDPDQIVNLYGYAYDDEA